MFWNLTKKNDSDEEEEGVIQESPAEQTEDKEKAPPESPTPPLIQGIDDFPNKQSPQGGKETKTKSETYFLQEILMQNTGTNPTSSSDI